MPVNLHDAVKALLKKHNITVIEWKLENEGRANYLTRTVRIPHPTNVSRAMVCAHEIGHVVKEAGKNMLEYQAEYLAETFAIQQAREWGFDKDYPTVFNQYCDTARRYVIRYLAKAHNRRFKTGLEVAQEILDFVQIDYEAWRGHKVFVLHTNVDDHYFPMKIFFDRIPEEEKRKMMYPVSAVKSVTWK